MRVVHARAALVGSFCALLSVPAAADPVTLTFDNLGPGLHDWKTFETLGLHLFNAHAQQPEVIGSIGFVFGVQPSTRATSPPNIAFGTSVTDRPTSFSRNLLGLFFESFDGTSYTFRGTDLLALSVVGTQPGQAGEWAVHVFGRDSLLAVERATTDRRLVFERPVRDIQSFTLFTSSSFEGIDDLTFNTTAPIPEPGTLLLVGSGLAALSRWRRR
jgi:hypothetical protein